MKKIAVVLAVLAALVAIAFLAFGAFVGSLVADGSVRLNAGQDTAANGARYLEEAGLAASFLDAYGPEEISVESPHGYSVGATYFPAPGGSPRGAVVLAHGQGGDRRMTYLIARMYLDLGYAVLAYDQRSSGATGGDFISFGALEKDDMGACVEWLRAKTGLPKAGVHGMSMGAATAGLYAGSPASEGRLAFCVMDSPYESMAKVVRMVSVDQGIPLPLDYALFWADIATRIEYGFGYADADVRRAQARNRVPTLVIVGSGDELCPPADVRRVHDAIPHERKAFWLAEGAHVESNRRETAAYAARLAEFLDSI